MPLIEIDDIYEMTNLEILFFVDSIIFVRRPGWLIAR